MNHEARFAELSFELPPAPQALGLYRPVMVVGNLVYLSGHGPICSDGSALCGRLGEELEVAAGFDAARQAGIGAARWTSDPHFDPARCRGMAWRGCPRPEPRRSDSAGSCHRRRQVHGSPA